ncbi:hypothetical protein CEXT_756531 [Caerostris extrusa]|uniref:Uncharacterized protein n=1 Tax=Caerostris extrusa TaxID=172846 RepID=A0AAV4UGK4_CAEEX|nr:hypothetical protein CEXT_756531 [Caerostris extrusa]
MANSPARERVIDLYGWQRVAEETKGITCSHVGQTSRVQYNSGGFRCIDVHNISPVKELPPSKTTHRTPIHISHASKDTDWETCLLITQCKEFFFLFMYTDISILRVKISGKACGVDMERGRTKTLVSIRGDIGNRQ